MKFLRIIARAAVAFYDELFFHFLGGFVHVLCWILVIPGPFALAGVYLIGQRAVRGKGVSWRLIWENIKEFGLRSFLLFLIVAFGFLIIAANLIFYNSPELSPFPSSVAVWTTPLFAVLGLLWFGVSFYAESFLVELKQPKMGLVLRNSLFLTLLKPLKTLGFLIVGLVATALSIALPVLVLVLPGFLATLSLTAVRALIADITEQAETLAETDEEHHDDATETLREPDVLTEAGDAAAPIPDVRPGGAIAGVDETPNARSPSASDTPEVA